MKHVGTGQKKEVVNTLVFRLIPRSRSSALFKQEASLEPAPTCIEVPHYISGPKVSTHPTGRKIERFCGVAEGPEVLFTLARPAE